MSDLESHASARFHQMIFQFQDAMPGTQAGF
jgi:hypothetical protein